MLISLLFSLFPLLWTPLQTRIPGPGGVTPAVSSGGGTITFINAVSESPSAFCGAGCAVNLTATSGNLLYVFASDNRGGTLSISDGVNIYTAIGSQSNETGQWYAKNVTGGNLTIVVSSTASAGGLPQITVVQFSGCSTSSPLVGYVTSPVQGASPLNSGTFSAGASAGNLIVYGVFSGNAGATFTAGSPTGMTIPSAASVCGNGCQAVEYVVAGSSATSATMSWTGGSSTDSPQAAVFH